MDDLEAQLARLGDHREEQAAAEEGLAGPSEVAAASLSVRWVVAAAVLAVVGIGVVWLATGDDTEPVAVGDATTTTLARVESTSTTLAGTTLFESRLRFSVELPADWAADRSPEADNWSDSMTGIGGGFLRIRPFDRPDRSPFVDDFVTEEPHPDLPEAVAEFVDLFPSEFGVDPIVDEEMVDGALGFVIRPSPDAEAPDTVTYVFEAPVGTSWRFLEIAIDDANAEMITASLRWLDRPPSTSGAVSTSTVPLEPDSQVTEQQARRVIADFLDATAAGEYTIAASYLFNEGTPPEVSERIGEYAADGDFDTRFADFCRTAACDASYVIGPTIATTDFQRTLSVRFETTEGPIEIPVGVGMFEGISNVQNLPPDGTGTGVEPSDRRIFGASYTGALTILRQRAVERYRDGVRSWVGDHRLRTAGPIALAGDYAVLPRRPAEEGGVYALVPGDLPPDGPAQAEPIAERGEYPAGASTVGDRPVAFLRDEDRRMIAVDLDSDQRSEIFASGKEFGDENPEFADASAARIAVLMVVGESTAVEVYDFDPATLTTDALVTRIDPEGYIGYPHIAPDGQTVAATLDPSFYDPTKTVAVFNADDGSLLDQWTLGEGPEIEFIDYDGRWIVAHLDDDTLWVVDTTGETSRRVDLPVQVAFG